MEHEDSKQYPPLSDREEQLATELVDIAYCIHTALGPGLLESIYEKCFCHELAMRKIPFTRQKKIIIDYKGLKLEDKLRCDILVDELVIVETKSREQNMNLWKMQGLSYMRFAKVRLGFIFNFNERRIKDGTKRLIRK